MPRKKPPARETEPPIAAAVRLGTIANTALAADLFATMLRSVEMEEERIAEEKRNGRTHDKATAQRK